MEKVPDTNGVLLKQPSFVPDTSYEARCVNVYIWFFLIIFFHFAYLPCCSVMIGRLTLLFRLLWIFFYLITVLLNFTVSRPILNYRLLRPRCQPGSTVFDLDR